MTIKIGFNKTMFKGMRGREITSIKALDKEQLSKEYLEQLGAVYREEYKKGAQSLMIRRELDKQPSALLDVGTWIPETRFQLKMASLSIAGDLLRDINKRLLKEWFGNELILITGDGEEVDSTSLLKVRLHTSKVYKAKQKHRKLHGVGITTDDLVVSKQAGDQASEKVLKVVDKFGFFTGPVTEHEFQRGMLKLKYLIRSFNRRFWQGRGVFTI